MSSEPRCPLVVVTGQLLDDAVWQPLIDAWPDREIIIADNASHETIGGYARALLEQAPPQFDLIGHAMGGFIAFEVLRQAPDRVRKLALISTLATADGPAQTARRQGYIDKVEAGRFPEVIEERIPMLFGPSSRGDAAMLATARAMAERTGAQTFLRQQRALMARVDSRDTLAGATVPILLVRGDEDGIVTQAQQDEMIAAQPGARLETIANAGHLPTLEQPATIAAILDRFLS